MHERSLLFSGCAARNVPQAPIWKHILNHGTILLVHELLWSRLPNQLSLLLSYDYYHTACYIHCCVPTHSQLPKGSSPNGDWHIAHAILGLSKILSNFLVNCIAMIYIVYLSVFGFACYGICMMCMHIQMCFLSISSASRRPWLVSHMPNHPKKNSRSLDPQLFQ